MRRSTNSWLVLALLALVAGSAWALSRTSGSMSGHPGTHEAVAPAAAQGLRTRSAIASAGVPYGACDGVPTVDAYLADGAAAVFGDKVQEAGQLFTCSADQAGIAWCKLPAYRPNLSEPGDTWKGAWVHQEACVAPIQGNALTLVFPADPAPAAAHRTTHGNAKAEPISGILRCPDDHSLDKTFTGHWASETVIDGLSICRYQLIVDPPEGSASTNTPAIVNFDDEPGQTQRRDVIFSPDVPLDRLILAPGWKMEVFARGIRQARQMALGKNMLYVGSSSIPNYAGGYDDHLAHFIYALPLSPQTQRPDGPPWLLAEGLVEPHGVAYRDGTLYFSTTGKLYRIDDVDSTYEDPKPVAVLNFPADDKIVPLRYSQDQVGLQQWHQKHPLFFNPLDPSDKSLYTAVGRPCNVCAVPGDPRYGAILKMDLTTGLFTVLARGVRNAVGFDWNPATKQIWFGDNNRQNIDNHDEINRIASANQDFGAPYVFGNATVGYTQAEWNGTSAVIPNDFLVKGAVLGEFEPDEISVARYTPPVLELPIGTAPLGLKFLDDKIWPNPVPGSQRLLVAMHAGGSGYSLAIRVLTIVDDKVVRNDLVVGGWRDANNVPVWRPVEFLQMPDGSLLVSDDVSGAIFRLTYDAASMPDTRLSLTLGPAPHASVAKELPWGKLTDAKGNLRRFQLTWDTTSDALKGLAPGTYTLEMEEVGAAGNYAAEVPKQTIVLAEGKETPVTVTYVDVSSIEARVTLKAPARPAGDAPETWSAGVKNERTNAIVAVSIPWGGTAEQTLKYGRYQLQYGYLPHAIPLPLVGHLEVLDAQPVTGPEPPSYKVVASVGAYMLGPSTESATCYSCHKGTFDSPDIAEKYGVDGRARFAGKVLTMSGNLSNGHCDQVCAEAITTHVYTDLWEKYLRPPEARGLRQVRKLTRSEYTNTIKDVFKLDIDPAYLPSDQPERQFSYPGQASAGVMTPDVVKAYYNEAMNIARKASIDALPYAHMRNDAFIEALGRRLFRRPITTAELAAYRELYQTTDDTVEGPRLMIAGMLSSPHFIYREELGEQDADSPGVFRLTSYEMATALSYGFLGTTPSDQLLDEAAQGKLETRAEIDALIDTMSTTQRGQDRFLEFIRYYTTRNYDIDLKEGSATPLAQAMRAERDTFVRQLIAQSVARVRELFDPGYTYLNDVLAAHYGLPPVTGGEMQRVSLSAQNRVWRGGLLHEAAMQASKDGAGQETTAMVRRGFTLREHLFCRKFGSAENDNELPVFPTDHAINRREYWEYRNGSKAMGKSCNGCHRYTNSTGATMENFDETGKYRTQEFAANGGFTDQLVNITPGGPIEDNGEGYFTTVSNLRDLSDYVPTSKTAMDCLANSYYRFIYGEWGTQSYSLTRQVANALIEGGEPDKAGDLHEMFRRLGDADAMRYRIEPDARTSPMTTKGVNP